MRVGGGCLQAAAWARCVRIATTIWSQVYEPRKSDQFAENALDSVAVFKLKMMVSFGGEMILGMLT
jgi:hypothetical protein